MNICVFSRQTFWQGVKGGMEIHGKLLCEGMAQKGHRVSVISTRHPSDKCFEVINGINIYYLKNTVFGSRRNGWKRESAVKFYRLHNERPFDIIWSQSFDAYGLTFFKDKKIELPIIPILQGCIQQELVTFFVDFIHTWKKPIKAIRRLVGLFFSYLIVQKRLLNYSDHVITASYQVKKDIEKWFGNEIAEKCTTIFNGIDTKRFSPKREDRDNIRKHFGIKASEILLLSAGRLVHEKGHHLAVEALELIKKRFKNVKLMIIGDGNCRKQLEQKIRQKGLDDDVIITGFIENDDTPKFYNSSDIFLMPTLREEGLPFVLLELMACEKPVIASKIGGNLSVVVDGKNGLFVPAGNVLLLAEKIKNLIEDSKFANRLASSARKTTIDHFSVEQMVDKTLGVMQGIARSKL